MVVYDEVLAVAVDQHGYLTARDAARAGIDPVALRKLAAVGRLERVNQGVYRMPLLAGGAFGAFAEAIAWTGRRGVISHESALDLLELCDVNPPLIHLTVPQRYAPRRRGGEHYRVWRRRLDPADVITVDGIPVMHPASAIGECLPYGTDTGLLRQACTAAAREGYLTDDERILMQARIEADRSEEARGA